MSLQIYVVLLKAELLCFYIQHAFTDWGYLCGLFVNWEGEGCTRETEQLYWACTKHTWLLAHPHVER